jgi:pimeloyl-ACP methyl ester carboxylesterase
LTEPRHVRFDGFEGIHLVADVWGDDGDWPVLLMHGGGQTRHAWGNTAEVLAGRGWRAVSLDLRGHGDSE